MLLQMKKYLEQVIIIIFIKIVQQWVYLDQSIQISNRPIVQPLY
jgi:hypothetical protein